MRKLISLGILALLMSVLASPVLADLQDCEYKRDDLTKGLYSLCVAFYNAGNENAKDRILENFRKKAGSDVEMPGLKTKPQPDQVSCTCWGDSEIVNAPKELAFECQYGVDPEFAIYGVLGDVIFQVDEVFDGVFGCLYYSASGGPRSTLGLTTEEEQACRDDIYELIARDFEGIICS